MQDQKENQVEEKKGKKKLKIWRGTPKYDFSIAQTNWEESFYVLLSIQFYMYEDASVANAAFKLIIDCRDKVPELAVSTLDFFSMYSGYGTTTSRAFKSLHVGIIY